MANTNNTINNTKELKVVDSYDPAPFEATITNKRGVDVYETENKEVFAVLVISGDQMRQALQLVDEMKQHKTPTTLEDAVEKCFSSALKNKLNTVIKANEAEARKEFQEADDKLRATYMNPLDDKHFDPMQYVARVEELRIRFKIGGTRVIM